MRSVDIGYGRRLTNLSDSFDARCLGQHPAHRIRDSMSDAEYERLVALENELFRRFRRPTYAGEEYLKLPIYLERYARLVPPGSIYDEYFRARGHRGWSRAESLPGVLWEDDPYKCEPDLVYSR